jgi:tetratricopeptide (TPR) repeat protein
MSPNMNISPLYVHKFVGRERELEQLQQFLHKANTGQGHVCFVTGEAGVGKSALVHEFVRRAEEVNTNLVAAVGQCNAQTGMGDAYLPFREVLSLLTGAQEPKQTANTVNTTNAERLKEFIRISSETLIEVGPDLIGLFVPGASLLAKVASTAASKGNLADKLVQRIDQTGKHVEGSAKTNVDLDQEKIFAQYADVLSALAQEHTLILILDDLHWADSASLNLLFHLARKLQDSRVLIIGTYRPDDVALGRGGERHPLEPLVNELKRYHGEIVIELDTAQASEGRAFVDALVDSQPNQLETAFRQQLFAKTEGHPLFTVELLRNLQERGDLIQDARGRWIESATLDWNALPARVEGVIEERIGRLTADLRESLNIGSVMGYDFYAQVVARVQDLKERELLKDLGRELDRRHNLVHEQGETKVGKQFLSIYRFAHALFQQFLYNDLSVGERRLIHHDVAAALETLVEGHTDTTAVQLARHYAEAGNEAKAAEYEIQAGDASRRAFAYPEARYHYRRALEMLASLEQTTSVIRTRLDTTIKYVDIALNSDAIFDLFARLQEAESLLQELPVPTDPSDRVRIAYLHAWLGYLHEFVNEGATAMAYVQPLLEETKAIGNEELYREVAGLLGWMYALRGRFAQAIPLLLPTVSSLEQKSTWVKQVQAATGLSFALVGVGRCAEGIAVAQECIAHGQEAEHDLTIATGQSFLALDYMMMGDANLAVEAATSCIQAAERGGELHQAIHGHIIKGFAHIRQHRRDLAQASMQQAQRLAAQMGHEWTDLYFVALGAEIAQDSQQYAEAASQAEQVFTLAQATDSLWMQGLSQRIWAQAIAALDPTRWHEVEQHLAASLAALEPGEARLEAARTHVAWGKLLAQRGNTQAAHEHLAQAALQYEKSELIERAAEVNVLLVELTDANRK